MGKKSKRLFLPPAPRSWSHFRDLTRKRTGCHLEEAYQTRDRWIAILNVDGASVLEPRDLLELIESPMPGNTLILTDEARKNSILGTWRGKPRLLLVPMLKSTPDAENMVIKAKSACAEAKDAKNMSITLTEADAQALFYEGKEFHLRPVISSEFLKGWDTFIDGKNPNGFLSFYNAGGKPVSVPVKWMMATQEGAAVTLDFRVLSGENTQQLADEVKAGTGVVAFVDWGALPR